MSAVCAEKFTKAQSQTAITQAQSVATAGMSADCAEKMMAQSPTAIIPVQSAAVAIAIMSADCAEVMKI